jgi:hypothetical protein
LQRAHFATTATLLRILRNRVNVFELSDVDNKFTLGDWGRVPQAGFYHFDAVASGFNAADGFQTAANELDFQFTTTVAGNITALLETIEAVGAPALAA